MTTVSIIIEGIDGAGKSEQARILACRLQMPLVHFPTPWAIQRLAHAKPDRRGAIYLADFGRTLGHTHAAVCDRGPLSTIVYQGSQWAFSAARVLARVPHKGVLLDIEPCLAMERCRRRAKTVLAPDDGDTAPLGVFVQRRQAYLEAAQAFGFDVIHATNLAPDAITEQIMQLLGITK